MPLLPEIKINHPVWQFNGHLQTIIPNMLRRVEGVQYQRERIETWDHDFLDLDWSRVGSDTLLIATHGLAGSSDAGYIKGLVKIANDHGWDALAWNYRGCSGEPNRNLYSFHGGKSDDLQWVIRHACEQQRYKHIYLAGISMGGNITMKLLGEWGEMIPFPVRKAVAISVPMDMYATSFHLIRGWNKIYSNRYLRQYKEMLRLKQQKFPDAWDYDHVFASPNLHLFVERFTAPSFGFRDAEMYLTTQSSLHFIDQIRIPTLLMNADNDPFLTERSYPKESARNSEFVHFLKTSGGGHMGFDEKGKPKYNWMERQTMEFFSR